MKFSFISARFLIAFIVAFYSSSGFQYAFASELAQVRVDKVSVTLPDVRVVSMLEKVSTLKSEIESDGPVIVNFVFTTCSTICSVQTMVLSQAQQQLDVPGLSAKILTFSIDPDNDTPSQMRKFAGSFSVGKTWMFYTGTYDAMLTVQKAFNVYRGSKANHPPVMFMKKNKLSPWIRIEGFPKAQEVVAQLRMLPGK
jgi:protein SCO1